MSRTNEIHIMAEAAQGYEGSADLARMLVRAAAAGKADSVKFQIIYADDLSVPGYEYFELFQNLEMEESAWAGVLEEARVGRLEFIADVFGPRSFDVARAIGADGYKLHSTSFFESTLVEAVLATGKRTYLSVGGIEPDEIRESVVRYDLSNKDVILMFGYQAEPTQTAQNNLARIESLREMTGLEVGFMDHSDGAGEDTISVSAMALANGVNIFEKHIGLDRELELEDFVSALPPGKFAAYADSLHRLAGARGSAELTLTEDEKNYRGRALKHVLAAQDIPAGTVLTEEHITLSRSPEKQALFDPREVIGGELSCAIAKNHPIKREMLK